MKISIPKQYTNKKKLQKILQLYQQNLISQKHIEHIKINIPYIGYLFSEIKFNRWDFNINTWDMSEQKNIDYLFANCIDFNLPLHTINLNQCTSAIKLFHNCINYNQPIDKIKWKHLENWNEILNNCKKYEYTINTLLENKNFNKPIYNKILYPNKKIGQNLENFKYSIPVENKKEYINLKNYYNNSKNTKIKRNYI